MKLIPASSAAWMTRIESSWSELPHAPNIIAPRQSGETWTPVRPSGRCSTAASLPASLGLVRQMDLRHHGGGEILEQAHLMGAPVARLAVDDAQRAERVALGVDERDPRVRHDAHVVD